MINALKTAAVCAMLALYGALTAGPVESTVMVAAFGSDNIMKGFGSGFVIAPDTVVTAKHLKQFAANMRVQDAKGDWYGAVVVKTGKPDWMVLRTVAMPVPPLETVTYVPQSAPLTAYGRFWDVGLETSHGASGHYLFQGDYNYGSMRVRKGFSGGPVCDSAGRAVGIVCIELPAGCLYVPISAVKW